LGVAQEAQDEVAGAYIMSEIREEGIAKRIVAKVLDGAAAISVSVSHPKLRIGEIRKTPEQDRTNGLFPREINDHLVRLDGVRNTRGGRQKENDQGEYLSQLTMP
jgi:hypothetical protein